MQINATAESIAVARAEQATMTGSTQPVPCRAGRSELRTSTRCECCYCISMPASPPSALTFRTLRLLADGEFHSGEALARSLRVSRTTIWNALQGLDEWGITLFKVHGRGYRLVTPVDWLDVQQINQCLGAHRDELQAARGRYGRLHQPAPGGERSRCAGRPGGGAELQTRGRGRAAAAGTPAWAMRSPSRCCGGSRAAWARCRG
jgi:biotin operon repressor BirA-like protein